MKSAIPAIARMIAIVLFASVLVTVPPVPNVAAQGNPPWVCDGTPILMRGGKFHNIVPDPAVPGNLTIDTIPGTSGIWNSTGYDPTTNWVYGVGSIGGEKTVRAYDAVGDVVFQTQIQDPYPDNASTYAGTVLGDGRYIIHSVGNGNGSKGWYAGNRFNLWSIDPTTGAATHIGSTPVNFADFSYNPLDGYLYQVVSRVLYKVDPNNGSTTTTAMPGAFPNGSFGASWFDAAGFLYLFRNNPGDIFKVDPADTSTWVEVGEVGSDGGTDAGSCVSQIDIKKDVIDGAGNPVVPADRAYSVGDTVTYQITLINNGLPTQNRTANICDVLPGDGRTFTGTWTSTDPATTVTSGGAAGETNVCFEADMPSSLWTDPANPGSSPTVITVDVVLGNAIVPGGYENQATLDFDQDGTVDVLSDDPGDGSDPRDPTTIEVLGAFTVSKTVSGHPSDNNADAFPVTFVCTTASGGAIDVGASSIVEAATGAAWPGATTNGFSISNGDDVRINGLPAGATCQVTEADNLAYSTTVVAGDGADTGGPGATSTGTPADGALVSDNCQDGNGGAPFNLQIRNATGTATNWEMIWRNRPYNTIPSLSPGPYTHGVVATAGGLFDHVFTGSSPLNGWSNLAITGGTPSPAGSGGCGDVEHYIDGTGVGGSGEQSSTAELTIDGALADESVAFTNVTSTIELTKQTSAGGTLALEEDGTFTFGISCDNGLAETVTITTSGGTATIGYPDTPLIAAGATCTVSESVPDGWELVGSNDVEIITDTATTQGATFENERLLADLTVTKTIIGLPTGEDPTSYTFDLEVTCTGGFATDPYMTTGSFAVGGPFVVEDLPVGTSCTVTEDPAAGFTTRYNPTQTVQIEADGAEVEVTNSTGALVIEKTTQVSSTHPINPIDTFTFTLDCTGPGGITSTTYTVETDSLETTGASGGLAHADIGLMPTGTTCAATEDTAATPEWTLSGPATVNLAVTEADPEPTAAFLNVRDVGSLTVTKALVGVPAGVDLNSESFAVDVSCTGDFTVSPYVMSGLTVTATTPLVIDDLPTGAACTVTEQPDPRFTPTGSPSTVTIDGDGETVALTNSTSTFSLDKVTLGSALAGSSDSTFTYSIVCTSGGVEVVNTSLFISTTAGAGSGDVSQLPLVPPGSTCTVTEAVPFGWTLTGRTGGTNSGASGIEFITDVAGTSLEFENTLDSATLTIEKDVTGFAITSALEAEAFTFSVECTGNFPGGIYNSGVLSIVEGTPVVLTDLPAGSTCTVTEDADTRFATTYSPAAAVVIAADDSSTVIIENETSTFHLIKQTSVPADGDPDATFDFTIECSFGGTVIYSDTASITTVGGSGSWLDAGYVPPGSTCSITEAPLNGWTSVGGNTIEVTTSAALTETVTFTNERNVADLTIAKTLLGPSPIDFTNEPFTVDVTCTGDFATSPLVVNNIVITSVSPGVVPDLPTGSVCTVSEDFDSRFQTLYAPDIGDGTAAQVTIDADGAEAGITNVSGTIAVRKDTIGPLEHGEDLLVDIDFEFDCDTLGAPFTRTLSVADISGGQGIGVITFTELPAMAPGTICAVLEIVPPGWTVTTANPQTIVASTNPPYAPFSNERDAGQLTITKVLDGVPTGVDLGDEPFIVDISCTGGFTTNPYEISGQTVTANTPLSISNLPTGAVCSVTETPDPRFTSTASGPVTIDSDGEEIVVTNTTSTLSITKTTTGPTTHPIDLDDTFTFDVNCALGGTVLFTGVQAITTSGQTGTWVTPDTPLLPPGTDCTVTEQSPALGWSNTTGLTQIITTSEISVVDAAFTNERETGELSLIKTVIGSPIDLSAEEFVVDISCTGGFVTEPYLINDVVISEAGAPAIADLPVGAACVVTEQVDPRFLPSYGPDDATAIIVENGSGVDIDNRTGTFRVEKQVDLAGSQPVDLTETFLVDATCTDGTTFTLTLDIVGGVTTSSAYPDIPLLPDGTACTVTEQAPPTGWTLTTANNIEIVISSGTEPLVAFTNERDTADLTVTKTVIGAPADLDVSSLVFTVDISCTGDFATSPLVFADQPITHGETITIPDLPTGSTCTVVEDADPRFAITTTPVDAATAGVAITDTGADVAIVNATGEIMIVKNTQVTTGHPVDIADTFTFDVDCGATHNATHTVVANTITSPTTATGFLRYDDIEALPNGTNCTVTEQAATTGWTLISANDLPLTVDSAGVVTATFTNERDTGNLTITKTLDGVPAGTDLDAELFDVEVTCTGGFTTATHIVNGQISVNTPLVIDDLPTGTTCDVVETADPRFGTAISGSATIDTDGEEIVVTNTTSTLSITKTTTGPTTHPVDLDDTFRFDVTCTNPGGTVLFTGVQTITTNGQTGTWTNPTTPLLPPGTECSVTEQAATGWTATTPTTVTLTTDSANIADAAFNNDRDAGELTITKTLEGVPTDLDLDAELFDVEVTCTGGFTTTTHVVNGQISVNTPLVIDDLPTNSTCDVAETADPRFSVAVGPVANIGLGGETINVTNSTGTFDIRKEVAADGSQPVDLSGTFLIDVSCSDGIEFTVTIDIVGGAAATTETADIPLLPEGTSCTISEQTPPPGWTLDSANDIDIVTSSTSEPVVSFTNRRDTADLTVTKTVIGAPADLDVSSLVFTVDISCTGDFATSPVVFADQPITHGETLIFEDLPTGSTCTVVETPDPRFAIGTTPVDAATAGVAITGTGADVAIVNATGEIMIVKNTQVSTGHPVDITETFDFTVDCGATYNETHRLVANTITSATTATGFLRYDDIEALPNGTNCTVTEQAATTGWTLISANDLPLTVDSAGVVTATFTNERDTGNLTITKTLDGVPAGTDLDAELFDVEVTCTGGFTTATHIVNGQISVNTPLVIDDLPTGTTCDVVETADPRFGTAISGSATIDTDGEEIVVTNTTSTLSITKTTTGPTTHPVDLDDTFRFDVTCTNPGGTVLFTGVQTITTSGQTGDWITPATPLLPPGTECSVTEQAATGWTATTPTTVTLTTDSANIADAAFNNDRDAGELTITKILEGVPAGTDLDNELFNVHVTCTGDFNTATHAVNGQISVNTPLAIPDLPTGATCWVAETPDPRFSTEIGLAVNIDVDGENIDVTNSTSTLSITKITEGPDTHPVDLDETFAFDVTCTSGGTVLYSGVQTISTSDQTGTWATPNTPLLPPGTECSVTEQTPPTGWTSISGETQTIETDAGAIVDAEFTNVRDTATLTVNKTVLGAPDGIDLADTLFDVTVTCVDGFSTTEHIVTGQISANTPLEVTDIPTGATCEIVEADDARFATTYFPEAATGDGATALITVDGDSVTITNSTGAVIVAKQTIVSALHPVDPVADFTFTIDCGATYTADHTLTTDLTTTSGASGVIFYTDLPLIPEGTACDITEHDETPEWTLATDRTVSLVASSADPVSANFTNTRTETQLTINKQIEGPENVDLSAEPFEVTVTCSGGFTEDPYLLVGEMTATSPFVIEELPYGALCTAVETPDDRFATTDLTGAVTLVDAPAAIDILNQTGSFTIDIDAFVNSARPIDPDDEFEFTVTATLPDGTVVTEILDLTTIDGTGTWESALFPTGTVITVSIETPAGWTLTDRDGALVGANAIELEVDTDVANVAFEVQRELSTLTIAKKLENVPSTADFTDHAFNISLTCTDGFEVANYELPGAFTVSNTAPLVIDDLPTGTTCEVTESQDQFFDATYAPTNVITLDANDAENSVTITNTGNDALQAEYAVDGGPLAFTGRTVGTLIQLALLILLLGALFIAGSRRRLDGVEE